MKVTIVCLFVDGSGINFLPITEQSCGDMLHNSMHKNKANVHIMLESVVFSSQSVVTECAISCYFQIYTWCIKAICCSKIETIRLHSHL